MEEKTCAYCGRPFTPKKKSSATIFCGMTCFNRSKGKPLAERFWTKVDKSDGCWLWVGARSGDGYGTIAVSHHNMVGAHRVAYELQHGQIPEGSHVLHTCDTPLCMRGDHLFLGDNRANVRDMVEKGRQPKGITHGRAKVTEDDVVAIRRRYWVGNETQAELSEVFGVNQTVIGDIVNHRSWQHVLDDFRPGP